MRMSFLDWLIVMIPLVIMTITVLKTKKYARSVADFMAAGRSAGRYLICNARGEAGFGAISGVAIFEMLYQSGFCVNWWSTIGAPIGLFIALSGFVIYRYRETRVMTLAQFFEIRYGKSFRIFSGIVAFLSGVINFGIFPVVSASFLVRFCGFPESFHVSGISLPTIPIVMAMGLFVSLTMTLAGGQLTVMVTDCLLGLISGIFYLIVAFALIAIFDWGQIFQALSNQPSGQSLINPFDSSGVKGFNIWYVLIGLFVGVYGTMCWQGGHAFNSSAANPHEAKMGGILANWRSFSLIVMLTMLGICAYTYLNHPDFAAGARTVNAVLDQIGDKQTITQMRVPIALSFLLPIGIKGVFCAIMLFAWLACDSSYLHSWGSIFIQDVVLPFRKKPFSLRVHLWLLRAAIFGVALFAFCFGLIFKQTEYILMFFSITGAIFVGGAGAVVIGGLYWKKGTNAAAWAAMLTGSILSVGSIILKQFKPGFPVDGQVLGLIATLCAIGVYVGVSYLTCREDFNMDRMLHRGIYNLKGEHQEKIGLRTRWQAFLGIDSEFTFGDKCFSVLLFVWSMFWFLVFIIGTVWNLSNPWPLSWWSRYYHVTGIILPLVIGVITTVWFTWGGIRDLRRMFVKLATAEVNEKDDGIVVNHHNLEEENGKKS